MTDFYVPSFIGKKLEYKLLTYEVFAAILIFFISYFVFKYTFVLNAHGSVSFVTPYYTKLVLKFANEGSFPVYSIWYVLVYVFSGFARDFNALAITSIILLSFFVVAKFIVTHAMLLNDSKSSKSWLVIVAFALTFVMPIISYYKPYILSPYHVYLGNVASNQWDSSTLILAMPFNILFFYFAVSKIDSIKWRDNIFLVIFGIISILCKPNFALAFLPVLCFAILIVNYKRYSFFVNIIRCILIAIPFCLLLFYQWYFTFKSGMFNGVTTIFAPFVVWREYSPHIPISLLLSIAFPLSVLILFWDEVEKFLLISWCTFLVALLMMIMLSEYPNGNNANYFWGAIASNYILFLYSAKILLLQKINWKSVVSYILFLLHFVSGIFLLLSLFINKTSLLL